MLAQYAVMDFPVIVHDAVDVWDLWQSGYIATAYEGQAVLDLGVGACRALDSGVTVKRVS